MKAKDNQMYEYEACGKPVAAVNGPDVPCPRPPDHPGQCTWTIPLAEYKMIATQLPSPRRMRQ